MTQDKGQVPEALRLADWLDLYAPGDPSRREIEEAAVELRSLHAQVTALRTTHVQKPAEIEHVICDVSKNGAESNMSTQQPAPATQQAGEVVPLDVALHAVEYLGMHNSASHETEMVQMLRKAAHPSPTAQAAESVPAPVQRELVATMLDALRHAQKVLNHNNLHLECGPVNAAILAARAPADSVTAPAGGETYHLGACIVDGVLYATVMRKDRGCSGAVTVLLSEQIPVENLQDRDVIFHATLLNQAAESVLEDAARYQWIRGPVEESTRYSRWRIEYWDGPNGWQPMQRERMDSAIDSARKQGGV